ncbi:MAG TPA: hypothetical protein VKB86_01635 [Pyrinomonadaceae bacterium]|nr:hypothetical protein [Pyrinomonadaceae bacterium]
MKKNLSLIAVLIFVLSFGGLVFAQNSNTGNSAGSTTGTSKGRRRHRRGRRGRRHGSRRPRTHGNTNS